MQNIFIDFLPPWVETGLQPAFYDSESGTVLQQTARMYAKVNEIVQNTNLQNETIADFVEQFEDLHTYVHDYFDNLDVQAEINKKLDDMASDGTITNLIKQYIDPLYQAYQAQIDAEIEDQDVAINGQNGRIDIIESKVDTLGSGTPAGVYATLADLTSADPDHSKIYVVVADGKWYYYNSGWTAGGTYQSQGIGKDIEWTNETANLLDLQNISVSNVNTSDLDWEQGSLSGGNGEKQSSTSRIRSDTPIQFDSSTIEVNFSNSYKFKTFAYSDTTYDHFVETSNWITTAGKVTVNTAYYYRFLFAFVNDADITADEYSNLEIFNAKNNIKATVDSLEDRVDALEEPIEFSQLSDDLSENILNLEDQELKTKLDIEVGSIQGSTGVFTTTSTRIRSNNTLHFNTDKVTCTIESGYGFNIYAYSDAIQVSDKFIERLENDWITTTYTFEPDPDYFYRFVVRKSDDSEILPSAISNFSIKEAVNHVEEAVDNLYKEKNNHPKLVCHRGMTCIRSENTLPAYYVCSRYGIKYVKCDIQVTADGQYVCSHQEKMQFPFVTPADNAYINTLTLSEIQSDYYISGPMFDTPYNEELRMPSLEQALQCFRESDIVPMIDMKTGTDYQAVYDILVKYGFKDNIIMLTSRKEVLNAFYAIDPNVRLFLWNGYSDANMTYLKKFKNAHVGFFTDYDDLTADRVKYMHRQGFEVGTYPINDYTSIQNAIDMGCDYIQSDNCQFGLKSDLTPKNLEYTVIGTGNYQNIIPDNVANIFVDYLQLEIEVFYRTGYTLTITIGEKEYVDNQPNVWHKIKLQKIKLNGGLTTYINCTDPNFMWIDRKLTLYTSKVA